MNTKHKGDASSAAILAALVALGQTVSVPWGENAAYDLVLDTGGTLLRVQCKTGRLRGGRIVFQTSSVYRVGGRYTKFAYGDRVDRWAVYCPDNGKVYLIPAADVPNASQATLHLEAPKVRNRYGYKLAAAYEVQKDTREGG